MALKVAVNGALTAITALPTAAALTDGNFTLLTTATASSSATLDFTSNINSTYNSYNFRDGGSDFDATKTTAAFNPYHLENDSAAAVIYREAWDLAQSTSDQIIAQELGNGNDESAAGYLHLFNPSNTTFVKHFIGTTTYYQQFGGTGPFQVYYAGYCNTTSAIDGVRFKMSSGNIDAGTIKMYGVGDKQS